MPDDLGAALTAAYHGDNPARRVVGMAQVFVGMENLVAEVGLGPLRNVRHEAGSEHQVPCVERPLVEPRGKAMPTEMDLTDFRAKLDGYAPTNPEPGILWNFEKFLIDRNGQVAARFSPEVLPDDPAVIAAIESALKS